MVEQDKLKQWQGCLEDILGDISSLNKKMKRLSNNRDGHINSRQKETIQSLHRLWKKKISPFQISLKTLYCLSERHYVDAASLSKICGTDLGESSDALYLSGGNIQEAIDFLNSPNKTTKKKSTSASKIKKEKNVKMEIKKEKESDSHKKKRKLVRKSNTMEELMTRGIEEDSDSGSDSEWRPATDDSDCQDDSDSDGSGGDTASDGESNASSQEGNGDSEDSDASSQNDEYEDDDFIVDDDASVDEEGSDGDSSDDETPNISKKKLKELDIDTEGSVVVVTPKKKKPTVCTIEDSSDEELDEESDKPVDSAESNAVSKPSIQKDGQDPESNETLDSKKLGTSNTSEGKTD